MLYSLFGFPPRRRNTVRDPQRDVTTFVQHFNCQYGTQHPPFFMGSYSQVLEEAKKELKFVLVYLHSDHHQDTSRQDSSFKSFEVDQYFG